MKETEKKIHINLTVKALISRSRKTEKKRRRKTWLQLRFMYTSTHNMYRHPCQTSIIYMSIDRRNVIERGRVSNRAKNLKKRNYKEIRSTSGHAKERERKEREREIGYSDGFDWRTFFRVIVVLGHRFGDTLTRSRSTAFIIVP